MLSHPIKILLIDDDAEDISVFLTAIREIDPVIDVQVATSAKDGWKYLKMLNGKYPDKIFVDYKMPEIDGIGFLEEAVVQFPGLTSQIIMYTGATGRTDLMRSSLEAGFSHFLIKPASYPDIIAALRSIINGPGK